MTMTTTSADEASDSVVRAVYATGPHVVVYQFPNSDAFAEFRAEVSEMNEFIVRLNRKAEKNKLTRESTASEIMHFHALLSKFQDNFGADIIPPDIIKCAETNNEVLSSFGKETVPVPKDCLLPPKYKGCVTVSSGRRREKAIIETASSKAS